MSQIVVPKIECIESSENYGRFVAEPLEQGWGTTLGNGLRRVLLSSLAGAAVTWVKIEGVQHEFSTVPHMKEDVADFLLNVKTIRLRPYSDRPGKLYLEVEGEGEVCVADIKPSADFEVINPELHLATLNSPEARLYAEFNVEQGKGFKIGSRSGDGGSLPIGVLPVDAIFSPLRRVNYEVEPARIGHSVGEERLILELWTDGTITPSKALSQSAQILIEQVSPFAAISQPAVTAVETKPLLVSSEQYNMPIEELSLSSRTLHSLRRNKITKLGELLEMNQQELLSLKKFGQKSLEEVLDHLKEIGFSLAPGKGEKPREGGEEAP